MPLAKVVQGERSAKEKLKDFRFAQPSRRLPYEKVVQGERSAKEKLKDFRLALPSRRLPYSIRPCPSGWERAPLSALPVRKNNSARRFANSARRKTYVPSCCARFGIPQIFRCRGHVIRQERLTLPRKSGPCLARAFLNILHIHNHESDPTANQSGLARCRSEHRRG